MWINPKINWTANDRFNPDDYNRIKNNLAELKVMSLVLYPDYATEDMGADLTYSDFPYAELINAFENNLDAIERNTVNVSAGQKRTFFANQPFIDYAELNRIESACKRFYDIFSTVKLHKRRLSFRLGGGIT